MKLGLLIPCNIWFCPFVNIYTEILDRWNIKYDLIYWNRDGRSHLDNKSIEFKYTMPTGRISKFIGYWKYSRFLIKTIKENKYDKLIVFTSQVGIFISPFLKKHYFKKYLFDYRDLSIEQNSFLNIPFKCLLKNSFANVISSPGFKQCLPKNDYVLSHNFIITEVENSIHNNYEKYNCEDIEVLTIGGIRDFESNSQVINALANKGKIFLKFVGHGPAKEQLESFASLNKVENIEFEGYYDKIEEPNFITHSTFLNIFYPDKISHSTALSNRFYNSLIYRRPMIVTKGQIQGDYVEKFNLGIAIQSTDNLFEKIIEWVDSTNYEDYQKRCIKLLKSFVSDCRIFENTLEKFIQS